MTGLKIAINLLFVVIVIYGVAVGVTFYWTITGHCCGSPVLGVPWNSCLPAQDRMMPFTWFASGHCDQDTWMRVDK